jgi:hypothetical protein
MTKYKELTDEDEILLTFDEEAQAGAFIACCDCGLVHLWLLELKLDEEESLLLSMKIERMQRSTGQLRRHKGGSLQRGECPTWEMIRRSA